MDKYKTILASLLAAVFILLWTSGTSTAKVGFAEWDIRTPGGHIICDSDPLQETHGMCLRAADQVPGVIHDPQVYLSHLQRWRFYSGYVAAETEDKFYLFQESDATMTPYSTEGELEAGITAKNLGKPLTDWLGGGDGWLLAWGQFFGSNYSVETLKQPVAELCAQDTFEPFRQRVQIDSSSEPETVLVKCILDIQEFSGFSTLEMYELLSPDFDLAKMKGELAQLCSEVGETPATSNPLVAWLVQCQGELPANEELERRILEKGRDQRLLIAQRYRLKLCEHLLRVCLEKDQKH